MTLSLSQVPIVILPHRHTQRAKVPGPWVSQPSSAKEALQNVRRVCALVTQGPTRRAPLLPACRLVHRRGRPLRPPEPHISAWDPSFHGVSGVELASLYNPPSPYTGAML